MSLEEKNMRLEYSSALLNLTEVNPSFDTGTLRIAYTGKNRNQSFISKETFEKAIPSMYGCPVVANYIREDNEFGSHDDELITDKNGELNLIPITQPVGFVPPQAKWEWEIVEDNNEIHQYLTTEVLLWKRQEAYEKIKENGITKQSMEITVKDGEMQDDFYQINDFYFTAFCLLGTAEPCFESAALFTFEHMDKFKTEMSEMLEEFKLAFAADERFRTKEGNEKNMDKFNELLKQYNVTVDDVTFEIDGLSDDELEAAFAAAFTAKDVVEEVNELNNENVAEEEFKVISEESKEHEESEDAFMLASQIRDELCEALCTGEMAHDEFGEYPRYYMVDYDESAQEVYFEDCVDGFKLYGAPYSFSGDNLIINFDAIQRKKFVITDFDEGEETFSLKDYVDIFVKACAEKYSAAYSELEIKYNQIVQDENNRVAKELFESFEEKLAGEPEFEAMKKSDVSDLKVLEDKLYAMVGRKQFKLNSKNPQKAPKAPVVSTEKVVDGPYGDLFNFIQK